MSKRQFTQVQRICEVCGKQFTARGDRVARGQSRFCSLPCYRSVEQPLRAPLIERFKKFVSSPNENGCLIWTGGKLPRGYGTIGKGRRSQRKTYAHRLAYEIAYGPIPKGMQVCHNCPGGDNPSCVNPAHLFLGTRVDNMQDALKKGTFVVGENHANAKLTEKQVIEIRTRYAAGQDSHSTLAKEFGVCGAVIWGIVHRKWWKHVA